MPKLESLVPAAPKPSKINVPTAGPLWVQGLRKTQEVSKKRVPPDAVVLDSALAKVAKVDSEEKIDDEEEDEGCGSSGLSSFFGAKAWVS